jgi:hypothetical protein
VSKKKTKYIFKKENELINSLNYLLLINCIKICTLTKGILKRDKTKFQESYILRRRIYLLFSTSYDEETDSVC